jgi:hypothetical protein
VATLRHSRGFRDYRAILREIEAAARAARGGSVETRIAKEREPVSALTAATTRTS